MVTVEQLKLALEAHGLGPVKPIGKAYRARCPVHDDQTPSLEFRQGDNGSAVLTCRSQQCGYQEILRALELWQEPGEHDPCWTPAGPAIAVYGYRDEQGELAYQVCRTADKQFFVRRPDPDGSRPWIWDVKGTRRLLFRLQELRAAIERDDTVYICEGEKDALALEQAGVVATTSPFGAKNWQDGFADSLLGARAVVIVADKDAEGYGYARAVAASLQERRIPYRVVEAVQGKDAADHLAAGHSVDEFVPVELPAAAVAGEPQLRLQVRTVAEILAEPEPSSSDLLLGPLLVRGQRLVVGGHSGEGKTAFALMLARAVATGGEFLDWTAASSGRVLIIDAEQSARTIKRRLCEAGFDEATDSVHCLHVPDGLSLDRDAGQIAQLESSFEQGRYDLVIIDPLYKLHRGDGNSEQEMGALMRLLDGWRQRHRFALVLPAHLRKPLQERRKPSLHDISGSAALAYGAETVVILQRLRDGVSKLHFLKDRDGELPVGSSWTLTFDREHGFRRDLAAEAPKETATDRVKTALANGARFSREELQQRTGLGDSSVRTALKKLACTDTLADDGRTKLWRLPTPEEQET